MKILIDIGHPANVHYFRNFAKIMLERKHEVFFTTHQKEFELELLKAYGFNYYFIDKHRKGLLNKIYGVAIKTIKLLIYSSKIKPDVFVSSGSFAAAYTSFVLRKAHITLEDTGNLEQIRPIKPFTKVFITPDVFHLQLGKKHIRVKSYFEVASIHPNYFKPNKSVLNLLGIDESQPYCLIRFVGWNATHDINQEGISYQIKKDLINLLDKKMRIFISSEKNLPPEFESYKIKIPPQRMHDALYFASLYIGEGATMASEAGLLGTPSIYVNSQSVCYNLDQEKYGTVINIKDNSELIKKVEELLDVKDLKNAWKQKSLQLLKEKIDFTAFLVWFVENYPQSFNTMKKNPNYQDRFFS